MPLTSVEESLLVAAYFRGGSQRDGRVWTSNSDQIITLSLCYTGDISLADCVQRFSRRSYVGCLYDDDYELTESVRTRYQILIALIRDHPELIEGGGNLKAPAYPTFTACRLTEAGEKLACSLIQSFPRKPDFPNWPDKRITPDSL